MTFRLKNVEGEENLKKPELKTYKNLHRKMLTFVDLNATQASIRAGYSPNTAEQAASRMLSFVKVQEAIEKALAERSRRTGINQDRTF